MKDIESVAQQDPAALNQDNHENAGNDSDLTAKIVDQNSPNQAKVENGAVPDPASVDDDSIRERGGADAAAKRERGGEGTASTRERGGGLVGGGTDGEAGSGSNVVLFNPDNAVNSTGNSTTPTNPDNNANTIDPNGWAVTATYRATNETLKDSSSWSVASSFLTSYKSVPNEAVAIDKAYLTVNPNYIGNDFSRDLASLPKPKTTVDEYCRGAYDECMKQASGPAGTGVCSNAYNACTDLNNCETRKKVCFLNENIAPKVDCYDDFDYCRLEAICRNRKTACVTETQEPTQCEGDRQACNAKIPGHLAECVSQKQDCLAGGDVSPCYMDYESCKATGI